MNLKIFVNKNEINDATSFYVDVLKKGFSKIFDNIGQTSEIENLSKDDYVLIITLRSFIKVLLHNRNQKIIFWFQGVEPEELQMTNKFTLRLFLRIKYFELLERLALKKSKFIFFVSNRMAQHYKDKYGYKKENFMVMPCYNKELDKSSFYINGKYKTPTFVYAGGLMAWQCFEDTLRLFNEIKISYKDARLTVLTREIDKAQILLEKYGIKDAIVKFVALEELQHELSKYKYGFLLRQDSIVNNVATPTKFNSYMSAGLIPVVSDVIHDFSSYINSLDTKVSVDSLRDFNNTLTQIKRIETNGVKPDKLEKEFTHLFDSYYNTDRYIKLISTKPKQFL